VRAAYKNDLNVAVATNAALTGSFWDSFNFKILLYKSFLVYRSHGVGANSATITDLTFAYAVGSYYNAYLKSYLLMKKIPLTNDSPGLPGDKKKVKY
jgi:hypothetical protein